MTSPTGITVEWTLKRRNGVRGKAQTKDDPSQERIPRISRLMALAIKFQDMVDRGEVRDYAELARLGHVSRARVTQIMNLLNLAPEIQEGLLIRHATNCSSLFLAERHLRKLAKVIDWSDQRELWRNLITSH